MSQVESCLYFCLVVIGMWIICTTPQKWPNLRQIISLVENRPNFKDGPQLRNLFWIVAAFAFYADPTITDHYDTAVGRGCSWAENCKNNQFKFDTSGTSTTCSRSTPHSASRTLVRCSSASWSSCSSSRLPTTPSSTLPWLRSRDASSSREASIDTEHYCYS